MRYTLKHFLAFMFFMVTIQMIQYLFYMDAYINAFSRFSNKKWNFSTSYKSVFWQIALSVGYLIICVYLYILYYIYSVPLRLLIPFNIFWYVLWDVCPILMIDNAYKEWAILLTDSVFAGGVWLLAIPVFNKYYPVMKHHIPLLFAIYCISIMIVLYKGYIYNRKGNENNPLVRIGDKLHLDRIL